MVPQCAYVFVYIKMYGFAHIIKNLITEKIVYSVYLCSWIYIFQILCIT